MRSGSSVGVSSVYKCGGRQSVMSVRSGLCNMVSRVGARERIVTIWAVASLVEVFAVGGEAGGGTVSLESGRRWRNSMDMERSVVMSRLTVLDHSLLRCLWGLFMGP